jgi:hypothetical protein
MSQGWRPTMTRFMTSPDLKNIGKSESKKDLNSLLLNNKITEGIPRGESKTNSTQLRDLEEFNDSDGEDDIDDELDDDELDDYSDEFDDLDDVEPDYETYGYGLDTVTTPDSSDHMINFTASPRTTTVITKQTHGGDYSGGSFKFDLTNHIMKSSVHTRVNDSIKQTLRHHFRKAREKKIRQLRNTIHLRNKIHDFEKMPHQKGVKQEKKSASEVALNWGDLATQQQTKDAEIVQQRMQIVSDVTNKKQISQPVPENQPIKDMTSEVQSLLVTEIKNFIQDENREDMLLATDTINQDRYHETILEFRYTISTINAIVTNTIQEYAKSTIQICICE